MEQVKYIMKDATKLVGEESSVLRYWENELDLDIPRNEAGHRYYTKENIEQFLKVKELKEKGYQLKAIRMILKNDGSLHGPEKAGFVTVMPPQERTELTKFATVSPKKSDKMQLFQEMMTEIVKNAMQENNEDLSKEIGDKVLKEMNYLMEEHQELEEERYLKLDAAIRKKSAGKKLRMRKKGKK